jgi:PAS domain S-box-containing protein
MTPKKSPPSDSELRSDMERLRVELQTRQAELLVINSIQNGLAANLDIEAIFELVGDRIAEIFSGLTVALFTYDEAKDLSTPRYILEKGVRYYLPPNPPGRIGRHLSQTMKPLMVSSRAEYVALGAGTIPGTEASLSGIYAPLIIRDRLVGSLNIESVDEEGAFSEDDLRLVATIANSMSVALENARLLKETEERNAELAIINTVQASLAAKMDIQAIYETIGDKIHELFPDAQVVDILLYDTDTKLFHPQYVIERGERYDVEPWQARGFRKHVLESGQPLLINEDMDRMAAEYDNEWIVLGEFAKSWVGVPMSVGGVVTGVISLQHIDRENAFTDSDVRLLQTLANSMSVALENARLFDETQRLLKETEERNAELAIINAVQRALSAQLDIGGIYQAVGEQLRQIFDTQTIAIYSSDLANRTITTEYAFEKGQQFEPATHPFTSLHDYLNEINDTYVFNGDFPEFAARFEDYNPAQGELPKSIVGVPIRYQRDSNSLIYLTLQDIDGGKIFTESDVRLLETLAGSMSAALENARLFDETQRLLKESEQRAAELQIINSVQEALASKLDIDAIYELVGRKIREIFKADTIFIAFHNQEQNTLETPYYRDQEADGGGSRPFGHGLADHIIKTGQPLLLNTSEESAAIGAVYVASPGSTRDLNESFLGVPIFRQGKPIGVASVQCYQPYAYRGSDLSLLQTLTNSMSVALENARLFDETERLLQETEKRAAELATINTVSQALVAETDLDALIELIGEQIREAFGADIVYVALLDEESQTIHFPYTYGEKLVPLKPGEGLTGKILRTGEPLLINSEMDKRRAELGITRIGKKAQSFLGVPIQIGGQTFGVISAQSTSQEERFDKDDLRLLRTIAANVGTAIRNAQLFEEVKRQKQYYEAVIENSPAAIILLDMQANVTGWNPAAERLFGYTEAEAIGRNVDDLVARSEELHDEAVRYSEKALQEKQVHLLARRTRKDGSLVDVDVSGLPVNVDGRYVGFIAIYHDVTELQQARQVAEQANRAKSTFLANMSHELRTPLNAIIGFTRIVRRKGAEVLPEKQLENLDKVLVSAEHLLSLINSVLDISKIEAGRIEVKPVSFELGPLIDQIIDTSQPLMRPGVSLRADVQPGIPALHTDEEKLKQIFLNLLSNAAKFTHQGEIVLAAYPDGDILRVDVADTGIGIPKDAVERIFEEFQQADSSTTREYGGTGLGLSISRSLARLLGGDLTACSIAGEGSTFTLSIPLRYHPPAATEPAVPQPTALGELGEVDTTSGQLLVLSIDDDSDVHELLKENLGEHGYQVVGVCTGDEGLKLARELQPFAITLDIMMPGKDGWQVLHELKSNPATRDIPVILLTIVDKHALGYQLGAVDYLVKPLEEGALAGALQRLRSERKSGGQLRMLVVDDDPDIPDLIRQLLDSSSCQVSAASDGEFALQAIENETPDVILLDLMMPRMDGFAFLEALQEAGRRIPVIVLTAKTLSSSERELLEGRVERIIKKNGLEQTRLLEELQRTMDGLRRRTAPQEKLP